MLLMHGYPLLTFTTSGKSSMASREKLTVGSKWRPATPPCPCAEGGRLALAAPAPPLLAPLLLSPPRPVRRAWIRRKRADSHEFQAERTRERARRGAK